MGGKIAGDWDVFGMIGGGIVGAFLEFYTIASIANAASFGLFVVSPKDIVLDSVGFGSFVGPIGYFGFDILIDYIKCGDWPC